VPRAFLSRFSTFVSIFRPGGLGFGFRLAVSSFQSGRVIPRPRGGRAPGTPGLQAATPRPPPERRCGVGGVGAEVNKPSGRETAMIALWGGGWSSTRCSPQTKNTNTTKHHIQTTWSAGGLGGRGFGVAIPPTRRASGEDGPPSKEESPDEKRSLVRRPPSDPAVEAASPFPRLPPEEDPRTSSRSEGVGRPPASAPWAPPPPLNWAGGEAPCWSGEGDPGRASPRARCTGGRGRDGMIGI
jgi:hypothetical protein